MFPAVEIEVATRTGRFRELHSDGGVTRQILLVPDALVADARVPRRLRRVRPEIYAVVNNELTPRFERTANRTVAVALRAYETIVKASTQATVNATFGLAARDAFDLRLAFIDEPIPYDRSEPFDPAYMRRAYALGFGKGVRGDWRTAPVISEVLAATDEGRAP